jgi:hypothetical protein
MAVFLLDRHSTYGVFYVKCNIAAISVQSGAIEMLVFLELAAWAALACIALFLPFTLLMRSLLQRDQAQKQAAHQRDGVFVS